MADDLSFLSKALESLAGAESEFANRRFDNVANRTYYCCFQAAVFALLRAGVSARGDAWEHRYVQAEFASFIRRRKLFPSALADTLSRNHTVRRMADYTADEVSETQARRALERAREFVGTIHLLGESAR